jgi:hypothetical protein
MIPGMQTSRDGHPFRNRTTKSKDSRQQKRKIPEKLNKNSEIPKN